MSLGTLRRTLEPAIRRVLHLYWRFARGMTLGVRAIVVNKSNQVFLVEHSYVTGWHLPGGGVEVGETVRESLDRELVEEGGITVLSEPALHGVFSNFASFPGDHITVFVVRHWQRRDDYRKLGEIAEARMFTRQSLPERTDPGTRARLAEIFDGTSPSSLW